MARLLVVSRSMALAMRLADVHEVIEHPVEAADTLTAGPDIDVIVLDLGEPAVAVAALEQLRANGTFTPALIVSGYQPSWASMIAVDAPDVLVVPLPITRSSLLDGVETLAARRGTARAATLQSSDESPTDEHGHDPSRFEPSAFEPTRFDSTGPEPGGDITPTPSEPLGGRKVDLTAAERTSLPDIVPAGASAKVGVPASPGAAWPQSPEAHRAAHRAPARHAADSIWGSTDRIVSSKADILAAPEPADALVRVEQSTLSENVVLNVSLSDDAAAGVVAVDQAAKDTTVHDKAFSSDLTPDDSTLDDGSTVRDDDSVALDRSEGSDLGSTSLRTSAYAPTPELNTEATVTQLWSPRSMSTTSTESLSSPISANPMASAAPPPWPPSPPALTLSPPALPLSPPALPMEPPATEQKAEPPAVEQEAKPAAEADTSAAPVAPQDEPIAFTSWDDILTPPRARSEAGTARPKKSEPQTGSFPEVTPPPVKSTSSALSHSALTANDDIWAPTPPHPTTDVLSTPEQPSGGAASGQVLEPDATDKPTVGAAAAAPALPAHRSTDSWTQVEQTRPSATDEQGDTRGELVAPPLGAQRSATQRSATQRSLTDSSDITLPWERPEPPAPGSHRRRGLWPWRRRSASRDPETTGLPAAAPAAPKASVAPPADQVAPSQSVEAPSAPQVPAPPATVALTNTQPTPGSEQEIGQADPWAVDFEPEPQAAVATPPPLPSKTDVSQEARSGSEASSEPFEASALPPLPVRRRSNNPHGLPDTTSLIIPFNAKPVTTKPGDPSQSVGWERSDTQAFNWWDDEVDPSNQTTAGASDAAASRDEVRAGDAGAATSTSSGATHPREGALKHDTPAHTTGVAAVWADRTAPPPLPPVALFTPGEPAPSALVTSRSQTSDAAQDGGQPAATAESADTTVNTDAGDIGVSDLSATESGALESGALESGALESGAAESTADVDNTDVESALDSAATDERGASAPLTSTPPPLPPMLAASSGSPSDLPGLGPVGDLALDANENSTDQPDAEESSAAEPDTDDSDSEPEAVEAQATEPDPAEPDAGEHNSPTATDEALIAEASAEDATDDTNAEDAASEDIAEALDASSSTDTDDDTLVDERDETSDADSATVASAEVTVADSEDETVHRESDGMREEAITAEQALADDDADDDTADDDTADQVTAAEAIAAVALAGTAGAAISAAHAEKDADPSDRAETVASVESTAPDLEEASVADESPDVCDPDDVIAETHEIVDVTSSGDALTPDPSLHWEPPFRLTASGDSQSFATDPDEPTVADEPTNSDEPTVADEALAASSDADAVAQLVRLGDAHEAEPLGSLIKELLGHADDLQGVTDVAAAMADAVVTQGIADAVVVMLPDDGAWRVQAGDGLRPLERRLVLDENHRLVRKVALAEKRMPIAENGESRKAVAGAPLTGWRHMAAVPLRGVHGLIIVARGYESSAFSEHDLIAVEDSVQENLDRLALAMRTRELARRLAPLRELDLNR